MAGARQYFDHSNTTIRPIVLMFTDVAKYISKSVRGTVFANNVIFFEIIRRDIKNYTADAYVFL